MHVKYPEILISHCVGVLRSEEVIKGQARQSRLLQGEVPTVYLTLENLR